MSYQELCVASKNEEKRLADLKRRQEYAQVSKSHTTKSTVSIPSEKPRQPPGERSRSRKSFAENPSSGLTNAAKHNNAARQDNGCFYCGKPGHLMKDCRQRRRESESRGPTRPATAKQIQSSAEDRDRPTQDPARAELSDPPEDVISSTSCPQTSSHIAHSSNEMAPNPYDLLLSSSEEEDEVKQVRVADSGSRSQLARVDIQGVPADGVVDTAADITIMGRKLFALVAASPRLKKKDFRKPDKVPRSHDRRVFQLDGCMELDITFEGTTLTTTVYIKMDAFDQLLLSEGVCRQLGIVTYHPSLVARRPRAHKEEVAPLVPGIRVHLVQSLKIPPSCSAVVPARVDRTSEGEQRILIVEGEQTFKETGLVLEDGLVTTSDGLTPLVITNMSGITQQLSEGTVVGEAQEAEVVVATPESNINDTPAESSVRKLSCSNEEERRKKMVQLTDVPQTETEQLRAFLVDNHSVFSLDEGERGETSSVKMNIDTGTVSLGSRTPDGCPLLYGKK